VWGLFSDQSGANKPTFTLVVGWVFCLVVEVQGFSDNLCFGHVIFFCLSIQPINGVLGKANGEGWVLMGVMRVAY